MHFFLFQKMKMAVSFAYIPSKSDKQLDCLTVPVEDIKNFHPNNILDFDKKKKDVQRLLEKRKK